MPLDNLQRTKDLIRTFQPRERLLYCDMNFTLLRRRGEVLVGQGSSVLLAALLGEREHDHREQRSFLQITKEVHVEVLVRLVERPSGPSTS